MGRAAADLQRDYGPWFSWVAVLSGDFAVSDLESVRGSSPVRFERLYLDRPGAVRTALGIARLPALLLVDEDGAVNETRSPDGSTARFEEVARKIQALAAAGVTPDYILRDPDLLLARRYGIDAVPALLVIDTAGAIDRMAHGDAEACCPDPLVTRGFGGCRPAVGRLDTLGRPRYVHRVSSLWSPVRADVGAQFRKGGECR